MIKLIIINILLLTLERSAAKDNSYESFLKSLGQNYYRFVPSFYYTPRPSLNFNDNLIRPVKDVSHQPINDMPSRPFNHITIRPFKHITPRPFNEITPSHKNITNAQPKSPSLAESSETSDECKLTAFPPHPSSQCCGVDASSSNRIIGGIPTGLYQYPWMAVIECKLRKSGRIVQNCGGSLISGRYVLTAGHCVAGESLKKKYPVAVLLGEYDKSNPGPDCEVVNGEKHCAPDPVRIKISRIIPHEQYNDDTLNNDIALIRLRSMAPYTDTIRPVCLPTRDITLQHQKRIWLYAAGWGVMKQKKIPNKKDKYINRASSVKRHVRVPFVPFKKCQADQWYVTPKQICAGGKEGKDTCFGDSGGPLMFENDGVFEEVGIVSFGKGKKCALKGVPGIYTHVFKYMNWIRRNIVK